MNKTIQVILLIVGMISCNNSNETSNTVNKIEDNQELEQLYSEDQSDRMTDNIDWLIVSKRDSVREYRVYELLDSNKVKTANDFSCAAMIFQHGNDSTAYGMAVKMMENAIELDSTMNKWLLAAAIDRELMSRNEPQIYGTQYRKMADDIWKLYNIDTTIISDAERREYGVKTLAEQRAKVKSMNKRDLSELLESGRTVDEIIQFFKQEDRDDSDYDLSEDGLNSFAYELMAQEKYEDALKLFKLNTELYPKGFNTYDSYGECLLKLGNKENAIKAYEKSLGLNPNNDNAKRVLSEIKK